VADATSSTIRAVSFDGVSNAAITDKGVHRHIQQRRWREGRGTFRAYTVGISVDPATNSDPWRDNNRTNNGTCDDRSTACADTACPVHTARADDGVRSSCRQGNEAAYEQ